MVLVGKYKRKRPLARHMHRWEGNIKMDLQNVGCGGMDWIDLVQGRAFVNAVMELSVS
jgi:hypothetical protein